MKREKSPLLQFANESIDEVEAKVDEMNESSRALIK